jgi:hypothetical protein
MKIKLLLGTILISLVTFRLNSQSFTFVCDTIVKNCNPGETVTFYPTLTNNTTGIVEFFVVRTQNDLPTGWKSFMCVNICYGDTVDISEVLPLLPPPNPGPVMALEVETNSNIGTGVVTLKVQKRTDPNDTASLTFTTSNASTVIGEERLTASSFKLYNNYPNPFNPSTTIPYNIPVNMGIHKTHLAVYNLLGQEVRTLVNHEVAPGFHSVVWDGNDNAGKEVCSGIYFYKLRSANYEITKKMILVK